MTISFSDYLQLEWVPTLGCTEPASIAYAAATARSIAGGTPTSVQLNVDPRIFKNCFAVGIPHSDHKTGIEWATAIGSALPTPEDKLQSFNRITPDVLTRAATLIEQQHVHIAVDPSKKSLFIDCTVTTRHSTGRAIIENDHTNIVLTERDCATRISCEHDMVANNPTATTHTPLHIREQSARHSFEELRAIAQSITPDDRTRLMDGARQNRAIATHGLTLFPERFVRLAQNDTLTHLAQLVCAGVYARMSGEDFQVISLAGSGNKGIVVSVPLALWGEMQGSPQALIEEALALACLVTSATTHHLGTLSAVCGCSNAAGIGLAAGLTHLMGGGTQEIGYAINNMVGNVSGMICDGAKIGCALKTMTSVDAAFRAAALAVSGIGIPYSDGIVGQDGIASLANLGRIAGPGMESMDREILAIMKEKLVHPSH
jgi:L-cysteine desulfidase